MLGEATATVLSESEAPCTANSSVSGTQKPCRRWAKGYCSWGKKCAFGHGERAGHWEWVADPEASFSVKEEDKVCRFFKKGVACKYGDECKYAHTVPKAEIAKVEVEVAEKAPAPWQSFLSTGGESQPRSDIGEAPVWGIMKL